MSGSSVYGQLLHFAVNEAIPLVLHLGISLESGNVNAFMSAIPKAICLYNALGNSNYANSCEIMLLQFNYWKRTDNPLYQVLLQHFHDFPRRKEKYQFND